jgi:hypothetical protein
MSHIDRLLSGDSVDNDRFQVNVYINTFPLLGSRFLIMRQLDTTTELCFLCSPCQDVTTGMSGA